jgi:hypothetical protein
MFPGSLAGCICKAAPKQGSQSNIYIGLKCRALLPMIHATKYRADVNEAFRKRENKRALSA